MVKPFRDEPNKSVRIGFSQIIRSPYQNPSKFVWSISQETGSDDDIPFILIEPKETVLILIEGVTDVVDGFVVL